MATTAQKTALGLALLLAIGTFSFIGYKTISFEGQNYTFKVLQDSNKMIELGIENSTEYCSQCDKLFYLKLVKALNSSTSVIIPKEQFNKMIELKLYDEYEKKEINLPLKIQYKVGTIWKDYPATTSLTLSTTPTFFKVSTTLPNDRAVSGFVGVKFKIAGQDVDTGADPIWWINGIPIGVTYLQDCVNTTISQSSYVSCQINKSIIFENNQSGINTTINYSQNTTCYNGEVLSFIERCEEPYGISTLGHSIDWQSCGYKCSKEGNVLQCDRCGDDGNCDGVHQSGESGAFDLNLANFSYKEIKANSKMKSLIECIQ